MMRVLSPHLDDAVLSLGALMATVPCEVITVFAGTPVDVELSAYDRARGFTSTKQSMDARRSEDSAALEVLRSRPVHLDFLDGQYQPTRDAGEEQRCVEQLRSFMSPTEHIFAPVGIGHPDHVWLADRALEACTRGEVLLYEELPYRVLNPEHVAMRLELVRRLGFEIDPITWPHPFKYEPAHNDVKGRAIAQYRSQFPNGADDPCLLVPERVWRCTR